MEISINEGEVPNHVTVVGGGRCLVSFTPEQPKPHLIDIKFNGETVSGRENERVGEFVFFKEIYVNAFRNDAITILDTCCENFLVISVKRKHIEERGHVRWEDFLCWN